MNLEEKFLSKVVSGVQSLSSSVHSTTDKNGHSDDVSRSPEHVEDFPKCSSKKELQLSTEKDMRKLNFSKARGMEPSTSNKTYINEELKTSSSCLRRQPASSKKKNRKGENPVRVQTPFLECTNSDSWICKNSACRALLSTEDAFCKRCSCCICHMFDDNKDPSLWLVCTSEPEHGDSCGMSCHVECALQHQKAGVLNLGQLMQLDGSYCCASCGKVSGILGCWKKQLSIAKDSRRVDALCYRIFMSYRLLDGTSRFKNLHEIVSNAKIKLETEVGPINGVSTKLARGIVGRLSVSGDVQQLCSLAIQRADEWLASNITQSSCREDSQPAACKFLFEQITSSSVLILLVEPHTAAHQDIKGFKLWYYKTIERLHSIVDPICVFPRARRRLSVTNLLPCTQYTFRIVSYTDDGDLGHSEARCFTKSVEILPDRSGTVRDGPSPGADSSMVMVDQVHPSPRAAPGFKVRELGQVLHLSRDHEPGEQFCETGIVVKPECLEEFRAPVGWCGSLDLNVVSVPDLNEEVAPYVGNGKRCSSTETETHDCDSTLVSGSTLILQGPGCLGESFEYCVKVIRWLECEGHIDPGFRMKLLTWFSLRSTEKERRVVTTFIQAMADDPGSLAGQLVDSFSELVSNKRPKTVFCAKLWH